MIDGDFLLFLIEYTIHGRLAPPSRGNPSSKGLVLLPIYVHTLLYKRS